MPMAEFLPLNGVWGPIPSLHHLPTLREDSAEFKDTNGDERNR